MLPSKVPSRPSPVLVPCLTLSIIVFSFSPHERTEQVWTRQKLLLNPTGSLFHLRVRLRAGPRSLSRRFSSSSHQLLINNKTAPRLIWAAKTLTPYHMFGLLPALHPHLIHRSTQAQQHHQTHL
ncbi:uncharacterized protein BDZ83DRAFT_413868 [Colletotrichum acutatum]|uniref:Uncharacterized protein n=1 Tax=Glomerella acutata TaxID=27357 RepID=A0AAD8UJT5_GLOAC|nr:uncharacterized protein BDZ83DRAFT_413868 [Colletotrichum acutatum]KAK1722711.1 hypothetical protein BDZ83DRAFT_413868 [Colletotrichum acutatum]